MLFDFTKLDIKKLENLYGGEKAVETKGYIDDDIKILMGRLEPGASIGKHEHNPGFEVLYIVEGCGKILIEGERVPIHAGMCHYCKTGSGHSLINDSDEDLIYFAVITLK